MKPVEQYKSYCKIRIMRTEHCRNDVARSFEAHCTVGSPAHQRALVKEMRWVCGLHTAPAAHSKEVPTVGKQYKYSTATIQQQHNSSTNQLQYNATMALQGLARPCGSYNDDTANACLNLCFFSISLLLNSNAMNRPGSQVLVGPEVQGTTNTNSPTFRPPHLLVAQKPHFRECS